MACNALTKNFAGVRKEIIPILVICFLGNAWRNMGKNLLPVCFWKTEEKEKERKKYKRYCKAFCIARKRCSYMLIKADLDCFLWPKDTKKIRFCVKLIEMGRDLQPKLQNCLKFSGHYNLWKWTDFVQKLLKKTAFQNVH